jgi:hypothetical protein
MVFGKDGCLVLGGGTGNGAKGGDGELMLDRRKVKVEALGYLDNFRQSDATNSGFPVCVIRA